MKKLIIPFLFLAFLLVAYFLGDKKKASKSRANIFTEPKSEEPANIILPKVQRHKTKLGAKLPQKLSSKLESALLNKVKKNSAPQIAEQFQIYLVDQSKRVATYRLKYKDIDVEPYFIKIRLDGSNLNKIDGPRIQQAPAAFQPAMNEAKIRTLVPDSLGVDKINKAWRQDSGRLRESYNVYIKNRSGDTEKWLYDAETGKLINRNKLNRF